MMQAQVSQLNAYTLQLRHQASRISRSHSGIWVARTRARISTKELAIKACPRVRLLDHQKHRRIAFLDGQVKPRSPFQVGM